MGHCAAVAVGVGNTGVTFSPRDQATRYGNGSNSPRRVSQSSGQLYIPPLVITQQRKGHFRIAQRLLRSLQYLAQYIAAICGGSYDPFACHTWVISISICLPRYDCNNLTAVISNFSYTMVFPGNTSKLLIVSSWSTICIHNTAVQPS